MGGLSWSLLALSAREGCEECVASLVLFFQVSLSGRRAQWFTVVLSWVRVCHRLVLVWVTGLVTRLLYESTVWSKFPSPVFLNLYFFCSSRASLWGRSSLTSHISAVTGTVPRTWRRGEGDEWAGFPGRRMTGRGESVFFGFSLVSCSFIRQQDHTRTPPCCSALVSMFINGLLYYSANLYPFKIFNLNG